MIFIKSCVHYTDIIKILQEKKNIRAIWRIRTKCQLWIVDFIAAIEKNVCANFFFAKYITSHRKSFVICIVDQTEYFVLFRRFQM